MKRFIFAVMPWFFAMIGYKTMAQDLPSPPPPPPSSETQEIIIRKKGEKDTKVTIEFKDDKVLVNGKPIVEFKDDAVTINNRTFKFKQIEKDFESFGRDMEGFGREMDLAFGGKNFKGRMMTSGTFLGVVTEKDKTGVKIMEIVKESAAEKAGLQTGDIITKINDKKVTAPAELANLVNDYKPKQEIKVYYTRNGKEKTAKAVLLERSGPTSRSFTFTGPDKVVKGYANPKIRRLPGAVSPEAQIYNMEDFEMKGMFNARPRLGLKIQDLEGGSGVKVLEVEEGSAAEKAGLKKDDIITEVGGVQIKNTDEAREQLHQNESRSLYVIGAKRNNSAMKFEVKIPKKLKTTNL